MRLNGEDHLEGGTLAFSRGDMDFAMQLINDGGTDAEPQSGALTETIALVKALKDVFLYLFGRVLFKICINYILNGAIFIKLH